MFVCTFLLFNDSEDIILTHNEIILTVKLYIRTAIFRKENAVTLLYLQGYALTFIIGFAGTNCDNLALCRLFLGTVRNNNPTCSFFFFLQSFDKKTII